MDFARLAPGPDPQLPIEAFVRRRERVADALGDGQTLVVATNPEQTRSNDVEFPFRPHSDFWYLTGFAEAQSLLVIEGGTADSTLFLRDRKPEAEVWTGRRLGVEGAAESLGVRRALPFDEAGERLRSLLGDASVRAIVEHHPAVAETLGNQARDIQDGRGLVARLRVRKDHDEVRMLRRAAEVGNQAMRDALPAARPGWHEYAVEAELLRSYRASGSTGPGYPPIVGAGSNAAVLHYIENRDAIKQGELVLVDAGCEWGYYNSDITRTVPADGAWTDAQAELYELVWRAQQAAMAEVRPGKRIIDPHKAAVQVLAEGFADLGWLDDAQAAIADESYRRFYMHGTSHFLGLDVHDVGPYKDAEGESTKLEEGMVITVEPGLYLNPDYTTLPDGVSPLGIRIESDLIVTDDGHRDLQAELASDMDGVLDLVRRDA